MVGLGGKASTLLLTGREKGTGGKKHKNKDSNEASVAPNAVYNASNAAVPAPKPAKSKAASVPKCHVPFSLTSFSNKRAHSIS